MSGDVFLAMALKDYRALLAMQDNDVDFADEIFGFHAEQAVEKGLKAWLSHYEEPVPRTHDLSFLLHLLNTHGVDVSVWLDLLELGSFGVHFRYDEIPSGTDPLERKRFAALIGKLLEIVGAL